ncbi:MAG: hypothetical protein KDB21_02895 [Acidimicrobiales bacterium]|nr:hypothetical protein [Acidimicrobiales bacterium]
MTEANRIDDFKSEVADLKLKTGVAGTERLLQIVGAVLMVVGVVLAFISFFSSTNQSDQRDQLELVILALAGVGLSICGAVMFLRYSLARFLRVWLLRQMYEDRQHLDEVVAAIERR